MKKSTLPVLFFFSSCFLVAQQKEYHFPVMISYDMHLNFKQLEEFKAELLYSNDAAFFSYTPKRDLSDVDSKNEDDIEISFYVRDTITSILWSDRVANEINEVVKIEKKKKLITEPMDTIVWEMNGESKVIDAFRCYNATCRYRGRNYTAWFTPDVPCNWGPWKLKGLPGAILEAYDDKREVAFYATGFAKKDTLIVCPDAHYETISQKEYNSELRKFATDLGKRLGARMEKGFTVVISKPKINSIELIDEE